MPGRVRAGRPRECGQTTVEAAFGLPIVFLLVLLLAQPGIVLYDRIDRKSTRLNSSHT